jgi:predicted phosphoadenosine phosphosulfate sulfurtransferase
MRHTEFWARMDRVLGATYARTWAEQQVLAALGHRTVSQALDDGEPPKHVWRAVWERLELPLSER